jgi:hypothetical protein
VKRLVILMLVFASPSLAFASTDWERVFYTDQNVSLDFPHHVFLPDTATSRDGAVMFYSEDRRSALVITTLQRAPGETPAAVLRRYGKRTSATFTYVRATRNFFVASGFLRDLIFYRRCNFTDDFAQGACFDLLYPRSEKKKWDNLVTRMSLSLRVGE